MSEKNILVVDDDISVSTGVRITLEDKYDVATVDSALDAFDYLADHKVDLILLDIKMPRMNGLEALDEIRKRHPETSVVMLTAYPTEENIKKSWESGANGFLSKPFNVNELRDYVDKALLKKR
ncbi:sporulation initiation phosphotransferase F [bacterium BMS3Bbin09]|nr:sporulation initiation phosphotransferase F [bacterium BMS3Bbin09]HDH34281.1 response regulator [Nitrospirota bacterium]